jgi:16S rRNA (cytosine967-C5)-methyltransferase
VTPPARVAAAAALLDAIAAGMPAEQALTNWARRSRFAGSGDRAAVRDLVFDALRRRRSCAALGGGTTGRALMLGLLRDRGEDPDAVFTGARHAPAPLAAQERAAGAAPEGAEALDMPDWILPRLRASLGEDCDAVCRLLRERAAVFLRVHAGRTDLAAAREALAAEGIATEPHPLAATALRVTGGARRLRASRTFAEGLVELQDAAAQAVCAALPAGPGTRVLDYCAGGGGKALALAARGAEVAAFDADPARMRDLPARAARARTPVTVLARRDLARRAAEDLVVADVPCSGSGAWRRQVEAKWRLDPAGLARLLAEQRAILAAAAGHVCAGGHLAYVTCSLLAEENESQVAAFLDAAGDGWRVVAQRRISPLEGGDGFFLALLRRATLD